VASNLASLTQAIKTNLSFIPSFSPQHTHLMTACLLVFHWSPWKNSHFWPEDAKFSPLWPLQVSTTTLTNAIDSEDKAMFVDVLLHLTPPTTAAGFVKELIEQENWIPHLVIALSQIATQHSAAAEQMCATLSIVCVGIQKKYTTTTTTTSPSEEISFACLIVAPYIFAFTSAQPLDSRVQELEANYLTVLTLIIPSSNTFVRSREGRMLIDRLGDMVQQLPKSSTQSVNIARSKVAVQCMVMSTSPIPTNVAPVFPALAPKSPPPKLAYSHSIQAMIPSLSMSRWGWIGYFALLAPSSVEPFSDSCISQLSELLPEVPENVTVALFGGLQIASFKPLAPGSLNEWQKCALQLYETAPLSHQEAVRAWSFSLSRPRVIGMSHDEFSGELLKLFNSLCNPDSPVSALAVFVAHSDQMGLFC
jgi:hypothetical protein